MNWTELNWTEMYWIYSVRTRLIVSKTDIRTQIFSFIFHMNKLISTNFDLDNNKLPEIICGLLRFLWSMAEFYLHGAISPSGPSPPLHDYTQTHHTRYDSSGRVISPKHRRLPDNTHHSQERDIHAPVWIETHSASKPAAVHPSIKLCGHYNTTRN